MKKRGRAFFFKQNTWPFCGGNIPLNNMPSKYIRNFLLVLYVLGAMSMCPFGLNHSGPTLPLKSPSSPILNIRQNVCSLFVIEKFHFIHKAYMSRVGFFIFYFFNFSISKIGEFLPKY
jgi:hypothetical protein